MTLPLVTVIHVLCEMKWFGCVFFVCLFFSVWNIFFFCAFKSPRSILVECVNFSILLLLLFFFVHWLVLFISKQHRLHLCVCVCVSFCFSSFRRILMIFRFINIFAFNCVYCCIVLFHSLSLSLLVSLSNLDVCLLPALYLSIPLFVNVIPIKSV